MTDEPITYDPSLDPCARCGAWRWVMRSSKYGTTDLLLDRLHCGDCGRVANREDLLRGALVGQG